MTHIFQLSEREKEVVEQLLQGKSNKLIGMSLGISTRTVEFHLKNVYAKFQVSSRVELILKLANTTGDALTEKLGPSTVDNPRENAEDKDERNSERSWATSLREAVSIIGQESEMKKPWVFHIANGILWASAIIAASIVGAPIVLSIVLLPTLAIASFIVIGPNLGGSECDV